MEMGTTWATSDRYLLDAGGRQGKKKQGRCEGGGCLVAGISRQMPTTCLRRTTQNVDECYRWAKTLRVSVGCGRQDVDEMWVCGDDMLTTCRLWATFSRLGVDCGRQNAHYVSVGDNDMSTKCRLCTTACRLDVGWGRASEDFTCHQ